MELVVSEVDGSDDETVVDAEVQVVSVVEHLNQTPPRVVNLNPSIDYVSAHLSWVKSHPSFSPKYAQDIERGRTYYQHLQDLYRSCNASDVIKQGFAKDIFYADRLWLENAMVVNNLITKEIIEEKKLLPGEWFVTIGFNHQTWTIAKCVMAISKILEFDWILSCKANFELYRENGEHPHCHFFIKTHEPRSKILEKLFRPKYIQSIVLKKSFIDIKKAELYHYDYINLNKTSSKLDYVLMDTEWREKNGIPNFEKKWNIKE